MSHRGEVLTKTERGTDEFRASDIINYKHFVYLLILRSMCFCMKFRLSEKLRRNFLETPTKGVFKGLMKGH